MSKDLFFEMREQENSSYTTKKSEVNKLTVVLLTIAIFLLGALALNAQRVEDTNLTYSEDRYRMFEDNDCSVISYAEVFNVSYMDAYGELKKSGRERGNPMKLKDFIKHIFTYKKEDLKELVYLNYHTDSVKSKDFVKHYAEDGYSYFAIAEGHVFVIEQDSDDAWVVKGNMNDKYLRILGWLKFENK